MRTNISWKVKGVKSQGKIREESFMWRVWERVAVLTLPTILSFYLSFVLSVSLILFQLDFYLVLWLLYWILLSPTPKHWSVQLFVALISGQGCGVKRGFECCVTKVNNISVYGVCHWPATWLMPSNSLTSEHPRMCISYY